MRLHRAAALTERSSAERDPAVESPCASRRPRAASPRPSGSRAATRSSSIGGGQAGLAVSWELVRARRSGTSCSSATASRSAWREQRWDAFCLVTPNWQCALPGHPYPGDDPDGFMLRDEIVEYVESYASRFSPPLMEGVAVTAVTRDGDGVRASRRAAGT